MMQLSLIHRLQGIHSALDDALGDTDVTHIENDEDLRDRYPVQWAAQRLAEIIQEIETPENADPSGQRREPMSAHPLDDDPPFRKLFGDDGVFERPSDLQRPCPQCNGIGWIDCYPVAETCTLCNGSKTDLSQGFRCD